jgi:Lectin C-type domain
MIRHDRIDKSKMSFCCEQVTWEKNWQMCCSLGMSPLAIDTLEEQQCLSNLTKSNWKGNSNYWTGATQQGCRGSWSWCDPNGQKTFDPQTNLVWETGQPDDKGKNEDCIHMKLVAVTGKTPSSNFYLTDRNCSDRYIFACEVRFCVL